MFEYPAIDPVAFQLGPLAVHWYGLMYLFGFVLAWLLGRWRAGAPTSPITKAQMDDLVFYAAVGVLVGGRLGYVLFYDLASVLDNPIRLLRVWEGGMSFHGGLLGVTLALWLFARRAQRSFLQVADFVAPLVPIGLGLGRLGNFINGELWGKPVSPDFPLSMVFEGVSRHPSMLYQAALEGLLLFVILWWYSARPRPTGRVVAVFLMGYGAFRILVEFVRLPDAHIGYLAFGWVTLGQLLSLPMLLLGAWLFFRARTAPQGVRA